MLPKASARVVPRQAGGEQGLAGPWRTVHQQVVTAGRRYLQRPLGRRLPFHLDKVGTEARRVRLPRRWWRKGGAAAKMVEERYEVGAPRAPRHRWPRRLPSPAPPGRSTQIARGGGRSEEHTSELQSLMRRSSAV